ncbi:hypothetical protein [[Clostridium] aminophilum]|uniref:ATPase involved in DNA repair n=1 Tax=[Clostridium] aminophilum TaxID=1526 RepID=A0A1I6JWQ4_9FIRM|nr:hypothetical protein [[Clostridium] aminophilum]SFR83387.1 hypothetical protein SAMN02910262_02034 [[Clostridium] aminophilum]
MAQNIDFEAFLKEAEQALEETAQFSRKEEELQTKVEALEKELVGEKKATASAIDTTVQKRRAELEESYDTEAEKIQSLLKKARARREKARNQGIRDRIAEDTEELRENNKELEGKLRDIYRSDRVPVICRTGLYNALYFPQSFGDFVTILAFLLILFAAVPIGVYYLALPEQKTVYLVGIYFAAVVVFGGLYVLIGNMTKNRHMNALKEALKVRGMIRSNQKKIAVIASSIRKEGDDTVYDLEKYDDEIARLEQDLADTLEKKKSALNTFESVTRTIITDEIAGGTKEKIDRLTAELTETEGQLDYTRQVVKDKKISMAERYESYVGREFMTKQRLEALRELIAGGEAANINEAREKYLARTEKK